MLPVIALWYREDADEKGGAADVSANLDRRKQVYDGLC